MLMFNVLRPNYTSSCRLDCDCDWRLLSNQSEQSNHWLRLVIAI